MVLHFGTLQVLRKQQFRYYGVHSVKMNLIEKIGEAQTVAELTDLERRYNLTDLERDLLFEKKIEIMSRLLRW